MTDARDVLYHDKVQRAVLELAAALEDCDLRLVRIDVASPAEPRFVGSLCGVSVFERGE